MAFEDTRNKTKTKKGWIAQMEEHWYGSPEVSGSSPGPVKFSLPIFQIFFPVSFSLVCLIYNLRPDMSILAGSESKT